MLCTSSGKNKITQQWQIMWTGATWWKFTSTKYVQHTATRNKDTQEHSALTLRYHHLNGVFIMLRRKLQGGEWYTNSMYCLSQELQNCRGQSSKTPLLRVNKHINSFIHPTPSTLPSSSSNFCYCRSPFLLSSPFSPLHCISHYFNGMPLEGQPSQWFFSTSNFFQK